VNNPASMLKRWWVMHLLLEFASSSRVFGVHLNVIGQVMLFMAQFKKSDIAGRELLGDIFHRKSVRSAFAA